MPLWLLVFAGGAAARTGELAMALLGCLAVLDSALSWGRLRSLTIDAPARLRSYRGAPFTLDVHVGGASARLGGLTVTPMLPREILPEDPLPQPATIEPGQRARFRYTLRGTERGVSHVNDWLLEARSLLGLFHLRRCVSRPMQFQVFPAIKGDLRELGHLLLSRSLLGAHHTRILGKGREFEKLREYQPGDAPEDIHWKATARRSTPISKTFQVERSQDIYVVVDHSRLSGARDDSGEPILDRFLASLTVLGMVLQRQNDRMGVVTFADTVTNFFPARAGLHHLTALLDSLFKLPVRDVSPDFAEMATVMQTRLRRRSVLIILTDLADPVAADRLVQRLRTLARRHHVLVLSIQDKGTEPLFTGDEVASEADVYRRIEGHLTWSRNRDVAVEVRATGAQLGFADSPRLAGELVDMYLRAKKRQVL